MKKWSRPGFVRNCGAVAVAGLIALCYFAGARGVRADPPDCTDCDCKMAYAWRSSGDSFAFGMKTQANPPIQILHGLALQVAACNNQTPKPCITSTLVDRYKYTNYSSICNDQASSRLALEVEPVGTGSADGWDINWVQCIGQNAFCASLP